MPKIRSADSAKIRPGECLSDQEIDEMFRQADGACDFEQAYYAAVTMVLAVDYNGCMVTPCLLRRGLPNLKTRQLIFIIWAGVDSLCSSRCPDVRVDSDVR